jgi:hypothetical protein
MAGAWSQLQDKEATTFAMATDLYTTFVCSFAEVVTYSPNTKILLFHTGTIGPQ